MSSPVRRSLLCFVLAFAMAFGSLLPHASGASWHDAMSLTQTVEGRHAQHEAAIADHGHSHDDKDKDKDKDDNGSVAAHTHNHNPADHSHETPTAPEGIAACVPPFVRSWLPVLPSNATAGAIYRLERPPRSIVIA